MQVVGHFSDSDAESNYALICNGLGLTFPDGTTIDQHDNAWDRIVCSFQFESGSAMPSLTAEQFQPCERSGETIFFADLTENNRGVPDSAIKYEVTIQGNPYTQILYSDPETSRIWVYFGYRPPMD